MRLRISKMVFLNTLHWCFALRVSFIFLACLYAVVLMMAIIVFVPIWWYVQVVSTVCSSTSLLSFWLLSVLTFPSCTDVPIVFFHHVSGLATTCSIEQSFPVLTFNVFSPSAFYSMSIVLLESERSKWWHIDFVKRSCLSAKCGVTLSRMGSTTTPWTLDHTWDIHISSWHDHAWNMEANNAD